MPVGPVHTEAVGDVAVVNLDDDKANALSFAMLEALRRALADAVDSRAVVLAGRQGVFSAGFDLKVMQSGDVDAVTRLLLEGRCFFLDLLRHPAPVIAACTGHALAAGALVLLSCDVRIGQPGAFRIGLNETAIGMPLPPMGIALATTRLDPRRRVLATVLAEVVDPDGALDLGYLDAVADDARAAALARATDLAERLDPAAVRSTKQRIWAPLVQQLEEGGDATARF